MPYDFCDRSCTFHHLYNYTEDWQIVYDQYLALALFVIDEDKDEQYQWLSDHFYYQSMTAALKIDAKIDGGRSLAEASCNVGKVFESHSMRAAS